MLFSPYESDLDYVHCMFTPDIISSCRYKCTNFTDYEFETNASYAMFPYLDLTLEKTPNSTCNASELESTDNLRMRYVITPILTGV